MTNVTSGAQAVAIATKWIGTPYQWGGGHSGPVPVGTPVDCSGLVDQVYGITGTTFTQVMMGTSVSNLAAAQSGDLVFFGPIVPGEPHHVGIFVGNGNMIDAPRPGVPVGYHSVGSYGPIYGIRRLVDSGSGSGGSGTSIQYDYAQLEGVWIQAGGNAQYAAMAAAIATAESGGNSNASGNNTNGSVDRGLWQINSSNGSLSTFDVMGNARAAIQLSNNGTNWRSWCTAYSDSACGSKGGTYLGQGAHYQKYLNNNVPPDYNAPLNGTGAASNTTAVQASFKCSFWESALDPGLCAGVAAGSSVGGALNPLNAAGAIINVLVKNLINPLIQLTAGVLGITGGVALMLGGTFLIVKNTQTYQSAQQGVKQSAGALAWLAGPEAGAAEQAATRTSQQAGRTELLSRQRTQAKQMSTQQLLQQEAARYGRG